MLAEEARVSVLPPPEAGMMGEKQWHQKSARTTVPTAIHGGQKSVKGVQCAAEGVPSTRHCSTGDGTQCKAVHTTHSPRHFETAAHLSIVLHPHPRPPGSTGRSRVQSSRRTHRGHQNALTHSRPSLVARCNPRT